MTPPITAVAVVVPARDEEELLPRCLDSLTVARAAAQAAGLEVSIHVVADSCTDGTVAVAGRYRGVEVLCTAAGAVGAARRLGAEVALRHRPDLRRLWLCSTDADCVVPPWWITHQQRIADRGADLVLGTVDLPGPDRGDARFDGWRRAYRSRITTGGRHPYVHGANLGIRASTYAAVHGWNDGGAHEDVALVAAVRRLAPQRVRTSVGIPVVTSARLRGRAPSGVADDLRRASARADARGRALLHRRTRGITGPVRTTGSG